MPKFNLPEGYLFADQFRILRLFASGAFGDVYSASDTRSNVNLAVKVIDFTEHPALEERFRREATILAAIAHPNIMRLVSTGDGVDADGRAVWYMATELISGRTVWNRIQKEGAYGVDEAVKIIGQACNALKHVHDDISETILHRDLKPDNLMIERGETVKVVDFGIAKEWDADNAMSTIQAGHPAYAPPEQLTSGELSRASDVYALMKTLSTMITGVIPPQTQVTEWSAYVMTQPHASAVLDIVRRSTSDRAKDRPQTMSELKSLLFEAIGTDGPATPVVAPPGVTVALDDEDISTLPEPAATQQAVPEAVSAEEKPKTPTSAVDKLAAMTTSVPTPVESEEKTPDLEPEPKKETPTPTPPAKKEQEPMPAVEKLTESSDLSSEERPMNTMKTVLATVLVILVLAAGGFIYSKKDVLFSTAPVVAPTPPVIKTSETTSLGAMVDISPSDGSGEDWAKGKLVVWGTGIGTPEQGKFMAVRQKIAEHQARISAQTQLAERLGRIYVSKTSTEKGAFLDSHYAKTELNASIRGARSGEMKRQIDSDGTVTIMIKYELDRRFWPKPKREKVTTHPTAKATAKANEKAAKVVKQKGPFTGIIVDARGTGASPAQAPAILIEGQLAAVYQYAYAEAAAVEKIGVTGYATSVANAKLLTTRIGSNPLVVKAKSAKGSDIFVDDEAAAQIINADLGSANLRRNCKVVIVVG